MGFLSLLRVASMPIVQVLIISILGAFMATDYLNLLSSDARKSLNKIVFVAFTPSLVFGSLAKTVTLQDIISWYDNKIMKIDQTPLLNKITRQNLDKLGNLGNILLIIIPAICKENGNPFGDKDVCASVGLSYVSFSMAVGALYIWTYAFHLIRRAGIKYRAMIAAESSTKEPNKDLETNEASLLLTGNTTEEQSKIELKHNEAWWIRIMANIHQLAEELTTPPILAAIIGFIFGAVTWLRELIIGENAPLRVINDSIKLLGDGTIPCITLILGGNLTQGLRKGTVKPSIIIAVICVRYVLLPIVGIFVVRTASHFGLLSSDPLYQFVLMIQFTLPPAMNIGTYSLFIFILQFLFLFRFYDENSVRIENVGTMTQLFDVAQEECSILFLWTYLVAAFALTGWSTVFMWILT
ncbi:PREDICTED: uncharacterized protein LOC105964917 [Erythranthe guttata]|uniref:uncharacterized protein LOC105964917 n=1 Tax=Erythranthe guttata TaxID=4155 RepID=UPI00064DEC1E|nr:PREDICTED: uncharacterized protein LOC105964917 [Erythranthe guttata]|eukprot:XP_012844878.1 PREDICTED: uncharacterized protein LOC105964917 [Erythranthe guttata]